MDIGIHVPEADAPFGLAVRPDVLLVAVSARIEEITPAQAVSVFKAAAKKLESRIVEVHAKAKLSAKKLDLGRLIADKASKAPYADAQLDGVLHVPLDESADYWARAELVARISEMLRGLTVEWAKAKPPIRLAFRGPVARVQDVTPHKVELTNRYCAQLRALTGGAEKGQLLGNWDIPDEVAQTAVSLEEVRLTLVSARKPGPPPRE
jgi:hypothetical protein